MTHQVQDIRDVMGMRTPIAWSLLGFVELTNLGMVLLNLTGVARLWPLLLAWAMLTAAAVVVLAAPGGDLTIRWAAPITVGMPIAATLCLAQLPVPLQLWFTSATFLCTTFMCVRNATGWAWATQAALCVVIVVWAVRSGQGVLSGVLLALTNSIPLVAATFFGATVRPAATAVLSLREQTRRRATEEAAASAILDERDEQLDRLDRLVRPMLDRIASGQPLEVTEQEDCRLLEARLRDSLRGRVLVDEDVALAAARARGRGVTVVMFDDGALDEAPQAVITIVRETARAVLADATTGRIVARVLPAGRDKLATLLVTTDAEEYHVEVLVGGGVVTDRGRTALGVGAN